MLIILSFDNKNYKEDLSAQKEALKIIKDLYPIVVPGDPLDKNKTSICLSFDKPNVNFYLNIFPIIQELSIPILLSIAPRYIMDNTTKSYETRANIPCGLSTLDNVFDTQAPFCTWEEINSMCSSNLITLASNSFSMVNLNFHFIHREKEIIESKLLIEKKSNQQVDSFIYPFGNGNKIAKKMVKENYKYSFCSKNTPNHSWNDNMLFRIPWSLSCRQKPVSVFMKIKYLLRSIFI